MAYLALIKGIFFHREVLEKLLAQYPVKEEDIRQAEASLAEKGFDGTIYGQKASSFLRELLELAESRLDDNEGICLLPFRQNVSRQTTEKF